MEFEFHSDTYITFPRAVAPATAQTTNASASRATNLLLNICPLIHMPMCESPATTMHDKSIAPQRIHNPAFHPALEPATGPYSAGNHHLLRNLYHRHARLKRLLLRHEDVHPPSRGYGQDWVLTLD